MNQVDIDRFCLSTETVAVMCGHRDEATRNRVVMAFSSFARHIPALRWADAWRRFKRTPAFLSALDIVGTDEVQIESVDMDVANYRPMFAVRQLAQERSWIVCFHPGDGWVAVRGAHDQEGLIEPGLTGRTPRDVIDQLIEHIEEGEVVAMLPSSGLSACKMRKRHVVDDDVNGEEYHLAIPQRLAIGC